MGAIDSFLQAHVASGLEPGETIQGMAHIRQPYRFNKLLGTPEAQTEHLAVATDRRLIVLSTELGGVLVPVLKPIARPPISEWRYHDIAQVVNVTPMRPVVHSGGAVVEMTLIPHPFCGPFAGGSDEVAEKRYDVYRAADGLDAQGAFFAQFPTWLKGAVDSGRFPMSPAKRAEIDAKRSAAAAQRAAEAAEHERKMKAAGAAAMRIGPVVAAGLVTLVVVILAGALSVNALENASDADFRYDHSARAIRDVDEDLKWMRARQPPPLRCEAKEQDRVRYEHTTGSVGFDDYACGCQKVRSGAAKPTPPAGWTIFPSSKVWHYECPPLSTYESERKRQLGYRDDAEGETTSAIVTSVVAAVVALAALVGGLLLTLELRKRLSAAGAVAAPLNPSAP